MKQIIENIQISTYDTTGIEAKQNLIDKKYTLDDAVFQNYGKITIPCGNESEYFELKEVNFVYLMSECSFNLLINNLVVISTKQFSFINPNKTITVAISASSDYTEEIEYCYGLLKCGDQDDAIKAISSSMGVKWDRVLKNVIIESNNGKLPNTVDDSEFTKNDKFANYEVPNITVYETQQQSNTDKWHQCNCNNKSITNTSSSAVQKVNKVENITRTNDGRIRYLSVDRI